MLPFLAPPTPDSVLFRIILSDVFSSPRGSRRNSTSFSLPWRPTTTTQLQLNPGRSVSIGFKLELHYFDLLRTGFAEQQAVRGVVELL